MKIILFVTKYPESVDDSYLPSEIADEWARMGHEVTVAVIQWENKGEPGAKTLRFPSGVTAHYFAPLHFMRWGRLVERLSRWSLSSFLLRSAIREAVGPRRDYDAVVFFAPLVTMTFQVIDYASDRDASYVYITDFFPFAAVKVGLVPRGLVFQVARWLENHLMLRFGTLGTMSPRNAQFLQDNYTIGSGQDVVVDMIWGPDPIVETSKPAAVRSDFGLPQDRRLLLFGGQLSEGRGVDDIIAAARIAASRRIDLCFVVIGDGRLRGEIERAAAELPDHLRYLTPVARSAYLRLASACDIGLVVTVRDTDVPTFPSRTIDYLRVGLPVLAAVEASTDFGEVIMSMGLGAAIEAGQPAALVDAALALVSDAEHYALMRKACRAAAEMQFNARRAARDMLDHTVGAS